MYRSKFLKFFSTVFILLTLTSCTQRDPGFALVACGSISVPEMQTFDLKGGTYSCDVLEVDDYGRVLFEYITFSESNGEKTGTAYVICQKYSKKDVYYYRGICYSFESDVSSLETLKSQNDWNQKLNEEKMTRRGYFVTFDLFLREK